MGKVISNKILQNEDYGLIRVAQKNKTLPGQFFMLRAWDTELVLSRPVSIYDADENELVFLYKIVGKGTKKLSLLKAGDEIVCDGPYGNGFEIHKDKKLLLIGGGVGIAPLYMVAKELKKNGSSSDIYFSLRGEEILREELGSVSEKLVLKTNERVVSLPDYEEYDFVYTCGPEGLMRDVSKRASEKGIKTFASLERRMGCGFGVCAGCSIKTSNGNKLVCKDGPVFDSSEVFYE